MKRLSLLVILLCSLQLFACAKPSIELGIASHPNINPDHSGRPSPVKIKMFELRSNVAFEHADFQTLFTNPIQALGAELLATDEFILIPGEARTITYIPNPSTEYIGIIAGFRQLDRALWRIAYIVDAGTKNEIGIEISDANLFLIIGDALDDWSPERVIKSNPNMLQQTSPSSITPQNNKLQPSQQLDSSPPKMLSMPETTKATSSEIQKQTLDTINPYLPKEPIQLNSPSQILPKAPKIPTKYNIPIGSSKMTIPSEILNPIISIK